MRWKRPLTGRFLALFGVSALLAACSTLPSTHPPESAPSEGVTGNLLLTDSGGTFGSGSGPFGPIAGQACDGVGGYSDIAAGSSVVVKDASGTIIGSATLRDGVTVGTAGNQCNFMFALILPQSSFYQFQIGNRAGVTYSLAQMKQANWTISLSLGN